MKKSIYVGPKTDAPSFSWVLTDVLPVVEQLNVAFKFHYFEAESDIPNDCDMVIFSKSIPHPNTVKRLRHKKLIFIPIDHYYSHFQIWSDKHMQRLFDGILVHNKNLSPALPASVPLYPIDHYNKYPTRRSETVTNRLLWIGVAEYLAITVRYLSKHGIAPDDILLLSDTQNIDKVLPRLNKQLKTMHQPACQVIDNNTAMIGNYKIERWSPDRQQTELARCKACIDVKDDSFRHNTKPPTKCQLHASSGIPQFVNEQHPARELLASDGITLKLIAEINGMTDDEIAEYGDKLQQQCHGRYQLEYVARCYQVILEKLFASPTRNRSLLRIRTLIYQFSHSLFVNLSSGSPLRNKIASLIKR